MTLRVPEPLRGSEKGRSLSPSDYPESYFLSEDVEGFSCYRQGQLSWLRVKHLAMLNPAPEHRVLELGFARGELLQALADRCALAAGLDFSPAACRIAAAQRQKQKHKAVLVRGDCRYLPFPDNVFDRVFAGDLIEHLDYAGGVCLLAEMRRVLRSGGILLAHTTPNLVFHRRIWPWLLGPALRLTHPAVAREIDAQLAVMDRVHIQEYTPALLRRAAADAGLALAEVWVDPDLIRSGTHRITGTLNRTPMMRMALGLLSPFRRWIGNDLYLRWEKP